MNNSPFDNYNNGQIEVIETQEQKAYLAKYMTNVYSWMGLALLITGAIAYIVSSSEILINFIYANAFVFWGLFIGQLLLVGSLSLRITKMSDTAAKVIFIAYSLLNGLTLSAIFLIYTKASIYSVFGITGVTFFIMALVGYTTKTDLTSFGKILLMALIGIIIATVVNMFFHSDKLYYIISYVGVAVFVGLIAYDTQKIKQFALTSTPDMAQKGAIMGALNLYLDFINLFIYLLRIMGRRRN